MKNKDKVQQLMKDILQKINKAIADNDTEAYQAAMLEFADSIKTAAMEDVNALTQSNDANILAQRGARQLTSEENTYYQKLSAALKSNNPKQALTDIDVTFPKTIIDSVFEDLTGEYPLLDMVNFENTSILTEIVISSSDGAAVWGDLYDEITAELGGAFANIDLSQKKLTAFIPISNALLDLGATYLDKWVRTVLADKLADGLEYGIVDGDGNKKPIGMTRALTGAVDSVYPRKTPIVVTKLGPETYGVILSTLSTTPSGKRRPVKQIMLVVNPADYFTRIMPATTIRATDGSYNKDVFPFPTVVVQSASVPTGHAIFGLPNKYFMGLGTSKGGKLEYSDEYKFLEDKRVYKIKLYGNGKALDENAFVYADISGLTATTLQVNVTNTSIGIDVLTDPINVLSISDARLASLTIGSLTLSPTFNKSVMNYTAATTNATNTITASAMDGEAAIEILNGETEVANGAAATWAEGENIVTVNVISGTETEAYTVTVTKS